MKLVKQHVAAQRRRGLSGVVSALLLTLALGLAACSGGAEGGSSTASGDSEKSSSASKPTAEIHFTPANGSEGVNPREEVTVSAPQGTIKTVALTNAEGEEVEGEFSNDGTTWKVTEPLGYGNAYTWSGTVLNSDERLVPIEGSFTVVEPQTIVHAQSRVGDGQTYGIAQPIAFTFSQPIENKAAVEKALSVQTSKPIEGSWAWLHPTTVHWRPQEYWKPHTDVHVEANLYGVKMGEGAWGKADITVDFSIGEAQVIKGNTQTHRLKLYRDGELIANYPVSYGSNSDLRRITRSGVHVVMAEHESFSMSNAQFGYENVVVPWAIRISNNGEFIHGYAKTIPVQGKRNVSHGCINMAPADAYEVMQFAQSGDPVEITGSSQQLDASDGLYYDWTIPWSQWQSLSALNG